jgi:hypothetical protein
LWDGNIQQHNKKWRPIYYADYAFLNDSDETIRQSISESDIILCVPHNDSGFGFLGIWDEDYYRKYTFGRFQGHSGSVVIKGIELVTNKPTNQVDTEDWFE